jgi:hypothetical protein
MSFDYLAPNNPIAVMVVWLIWVGLGLFCLSVYLAYRRTWGERRLRSNIRSILSSLKNAQLTAALEVQPEAPSVSPGEVFKEICASGDVDIAHPISMVIRSAFISGTKRHKFDFSTAAQRLGTDLSSRPRWMARLLPLFLILGLLGTLLGLAGTIESLTEVLRQNEDVALGLSALLMNLKGAFAPSISGVMATLIGTGVYMIYQRRILNPSVSDAAALIACELSEYLCPSAPELSDEAIQRALDAASQVRSVATEIEKKTGSFRHTVEGATAISESFSGAMTALDSAVRNSRQEVEGAIGSLAQKILQLDNALSRWKDIEGQLAQYYGRLTDAEEAQVKETREMRLLLAETKNATATLRDVLSAQINSSFTALGHVIEQLAAGFVDVDVPLKEAASAIADNSERMCLQFAQMMGSIETSLGKQASDVKNAYELGAQKMTEFEGMLINLVENKSQELSNALGHLRRPFEDVAASLQRQILNYQQVMEPRFATIAEQTEVLKRIEIKLDALGANHTASVPQSGSAILSNGKPTEVRICNIDELVALMPPPGLLARLLRWGNGH